jgi:hypothetical protein
MDVSGVSVTMVYDGSTWQLYPQTGTAPSLGIVDNATSTAITIDSSERVLIGTDSGDAFHASASLRVQNASGASYIQVKTPTDQSGGLLFGDTDDDFRGGFFYDNSTDHLAVYANDAERMRIDSSGDVGIGVSDPLYKLQVAGATADADGALGSQSPQFSIQGGNANNQFEFGMDNSGGTAIGFLQSRNLSAGAQDIALNPAGGKVSVGSGGLEIKTGSTVAGTLKAVTNQLVIHGSGADSGVYYGSTTWYPYKNGAYSDNVIDLGAGSQRFDDLYATNGTINTSDAREKQDIEELTEAETRVAVAAKALLRKYRWKSAVESKDDNTESDETARIHFGIIAQDLKAAFEAEGLDAGRYAMFIHSTWTDEETGEECDRMGVRYSELLAFIIAAI